MAGIFIVRYDVSAVHCQTRFESDMVDESRRFAN